jgi:hypothetical protein
MDSQATPNSNVSLNIVNITHVRAIETQSQVCNSVGGIAKGEKDDSDDDADDDIDFTDDDSSGSEFDDSDDDNPVHFSIVYKKGGQTKKMRLW